MSWYVKQSIITDLNAAGFIDLQEVKLVTTDGLIPRAEYSYQVGGIVHNIDLANSYLKVANVIYPLLSANSPTVVDGVNAISEVNGELVFANLVGSTLNLSTDNYTYGIQFSITQIYGSFPTPAGGYGVEMQAPYSFAAPLVTLSSPIVVGGAIVGSVNGSPIDNEVKYNGQPLPEGSILRNSVTGQKFMKIAGGTQAFVAIPLTPDSSWNWLTGSDFWAILQSF